MSEEGSKTPNAAEHVLRMQKALESQPQWIYPKVFLYTPSTAFTFPDYPGLSVGLRYYIITGKIGWWIAVFLLLAMNLFYGIFTLGLGLLITVPVSFLALLFLNLTLALQFATCELVQVVVRMERHLASISGRQKKS